LFINLSFEKAVQAMGSEVAAETNSIAVMKAPASVVRLWRAVEIVKSIFIPLEFEVGSNSRIHHWSVPTSMHGACQMKIVVCFQWKQRLGIAQ